MSVGQPSFTHVRTDMADLPRPALDISKSLIFVLVFVAMATLVGLGKVDAEKLQYLLLILVPSPIGEVKKEEKS